jgi:transcriptional regulator with XRE-family HTH domain
MKRAAKKKAMDPKEEFRELLRASGWSQAEAARQLAMTPSGLSQIVRENSTVRPSAVTLRLFRLLLMRPAEGEAPTGAPAKKVAVEEPWEADVLESLRKVSPKARQLILETMRAMLSAAQGTGVDKKRSRPKLSGGGATGSGA